MTVLTRPQVSREDLIAWQAHGTCRAGASALFSGITRDASGYELAQVGPETSRLCGPCPVAQVCLEAALLLERDGRDRTGVWGGLTPDQRATLADRRMPRREVP